VAKAVFGGIGEFPANTSATRTPEMNIRKLPDKTLAGVKQQ